MVNPADLQQSSQQTLKSKRAKNGVVQALKDNNCQAKLLEIAELLKTEEEKFPL